MRFINYTYNLNKFNSKMLGISLPNEVLLKIDKDRGLIPRSRYLLKLIEIAYNTNEIKQKEHLDDCKRKKYLV
jgi:hypothetical protein